MKMTDIKTLVEESGGVATFKMVDVRDAHGAGRLGVHVRTNITKELKGLGLGHFPSELPDSQYAEVRIYKLGSPVADLIEAVLKPGAAGDVQLREAASSEAQRILAEIRGIVCS